MRKLGFALLSLLLLSEALAQRATDGKMAEAALFPFVGTTDPAERIDVLSRYQQTLDENTLTRPSQLRSASIVFKTGLSPDELVNFAGRYNLTVVGFHAKAPMDDDGTIFSVIVGMDDLLAVKGSLREQLSFAIDLARARILELSDGYARADSGPEDRQRAEEYRQLTTAEQKLFSIEAFGSSSSLSQASRAGIVATAFLDNQEWKIEEYRRRTNSR